MGSLLIFLDLLGVTEPTVNLQSSVTHRNSFLTRDISTLSNMLMSSNLGLSRVAVEGLTWAFRRTPFFLGGQVPVLTGGMTMAAGATMRSALDDRRVASSGGNTRKGLGELDHFMRALHHVCDWSRRPQRYEGHLPPRLRPHRSPTQQKVSLPKIIWN